MRARETRGDDPGAPGPKGDPGESVIATPIAPLAVECAEQGGAFVEEEDGDPQVEVCNGAAGEDGSPWTATGALPTPAELPPGKLATLTGAWSFTGTDADTAGVFAPISFSLKLAAALTKTKVHYETETNFADFDEGGPEAIGCLGTQSNPTTPSGNLCVYGGAFNVNNATFDGIRRVDGASAGASKAGAVLHFTIGTGVGFGNGLGAPVGLVCPA